MIFFFPTGFPIDFWALEMDGKRPTTKRKATRIAIFDRESISYYDMFVFFNELDNQVLYDIF